MTVLRNLRDWTMVGVAALSLAAAAPGWIVLRFALAEAHADPATAEALFAPFAGDGLVGDLAARERLRLATPPSPQERIAAVDALLSETPLNSGAWLDLAMARRAAGAPMASVLAALALSTTTGPNESRFMAGRAAFALPLWTALPPGARRASIADLVGGWESLDEAGRRRLAAILGSAADRSGGEIRAALLLSGAPGAKVAAALMLRAPAAGGGAPPSNASVGDVAPAK